MIEFTNDWSYLGQGEWFFTLFQLNYSNLFFHHEYKITIINFTLKYRFQKH